jgi:tRNA threonylcarbamoyladenosine modification (KEOPS) complex  Pcc1 subunit
MIKATITVGNVDSNTVQKSLGPELEIGFTRANAQIEKHKKGIKLIFTADDVTALRATMNSYLRWLKVITDIDQELKNK